MDSKLRKNRLMIIINTNVGANYELLEMSNQGLLIISAT